jgi:5-methyltetrahydrofolate--homocysteine methyltransferase
MAWKPRDRARCEEAVSVNELKAISQAVESGDDKQVVRIAKDALKKGISAVDILEKGLVPGIQELGKLFKDGQVYLPEILISTRAMNRGVEELKPYLAGADIHKKGTVVIGTVEGDLHDIGKNLVKLMLESNGFNVVDLGVDVPVNAFVDAVRKYNPHILAMSSLLTMTMTHMPNVIVALREARLKSELKVMIGGAPINREFANAIGAEGFAEDCVTAVDEAMRLIKLSGGH